VGAGRFHSQDGIWPSLVALAEMQTMRANSSQEQVAELYFLDSMKCTSESTSSARSRPIGPVL
jgi:hypothetical protein